MCRAIQELKDERDTVCKAIQELKDERDKAETHAAQTLVTGSIGNKNIQ